MEEQIPAVDGNASTLNKQAWSDGKGWSSRFGVEHGAKNPLTPTPKKN
jgi:hypothetical protein